MAGTIPLSLSQQFDTLGKPLSGGRLYTFQAGTVSTPQNAYSDSDLTIPLPNPIECDSAGRLPQFFLADGEIKIRLTDRNGVVQIDADNILVVGASSGGGGGGGSVDATRLISTGDLKARYGTGTLSGYVRANGRTIGSATSGASERANADTEALFLYLWGADSNLAVAGGRGVSAAADWAANKTIQLPDWRGRVIAGLDDMGNSAAGRLTLTYFGTSAIVLGASGGSQSHTLTVAELAEHSHEGVMPRTTVTRNTSSAPIIAPGSGSPSNGTASSTDFNSYQTSQYTQAVVPETALEIEAAGDNAPHKNVQPTMLATIYIKL